MEAISGKKLSARLNPPLVAALIGVLLTCWGCSTSRQYIVAESGDGWMRFGSEGPKVWRGRHIDSGLEISVEKRYANDPGDIVLRVKIFPPLIPEPGEAAAFTIDPLNLYGMLDNAAGVEVDHVYSCSEVGANDDLSDATQVTKEEPLSEGACYYFLYKGIATRKGERIYFFSNFIRYGQMLHTLRLGEDRDTSLRGPMQFNPTHNTKMSNSARGWGHFPCLILLGP